MRRSLTSVASLLRRRHFHQAVCVRYTYASTGAEKQGEQANVSGDDTERLYDTHVPTTCIQRALLAAGSSLMAFADPTRDDMVATLGEVTGTYALRQMEATMRADAIGQQILAERPRVSSQSVRLSELPQLDGNSFGYAYANWINSQGITPDSRKAVKFVDDATLAYVMQRYREVHDFTHVALNQPITLLGEAFVKAFEAVQTGLPMCGLAAIFAPLKLTSDERMTLITRGLPWIAANARRARPFFCVYFEKHFDMPLAQLRRDVLRIDEPPFGVKLTK